MKPTLRRALAAVALAWAGHASADITIGVSLPLTGPASGLGIPMQNGFKLWPASLAGEKVKLVILDDATDPTKGVQNARRLTTEDRVDLLMGSGATPVAIPMAEVATETRTPHLAMSPAPLPPGKDHWTFRLPQSNAVMAHAIVTHMQKAGVKTVGFIGYTDAYGESWLQEVSPLLNKAGIRLVATERFARADTAVTAQALKLHGANPDAVLIVASGSGAAMPQLAILERGFKGKVYQTHAAASRDLMRVAGKAAEGTFVSSGPVVVADQLPAGHPNKAHGTKFVEGYEKLFGAGSRNQLAAHAYDGYLLLEQVLPVALKKARPGTPEFRAALRDAIEGAQGMAVSHGTLDYSATDHWGFRHDSAVILKVVNNDWKLEP